MVGGFGIFRIIPLPYQCILSQKELSVVVTAYQGQIRSADRDYRNFAIYTWGILLRYVPRVIWRWKKVTLWWNSSLFCIRFVKMWKSIIFSVWWHTLTFAFFLICPNLSKYMWFKIVCKLLKMSYLTLQFQKGLTFCFYHVLMKLFKNNDFIPFILNGELKFVTYVLEQHPVNTSWLYFLVF